MRSPRTIARVGLASLLGSLATLGATRAHADTASGLAGCDAASLTCSVGTAPLKAAVKNQFPTQIDSGLMDKGLIKIRTRFTIDPIDGDPLLAIDMPKGALVEASWSEKGFVVVKPVTSPDKTAMGSMKVHYTLTPSLEASIYGIGVNYDASQLINKVPGAKFNYDATAATSILPWGFQAAALKVPAPALDQSTIFAIPFSNLGVDSSIVEGTLSIQAAANPTFTYVTKSVRLDSGTVTTADGSAKLVIGDEDFLDLNASVDGELSLGGTLDIRPIIKVDSVDGYPTFGLVKYGFNAVSKPIGGGAPMPVSFGTTQIHIPLPNLKVPSATVAMGTIKAGQQAEQIVTIDSTGELGGKLTFESSDPQFTVPAGEARVGAKSKLPLKVVFKATSDGSASATITVRSNDPDSPEQTFRVAANGASLDPKGEDGTNDPRSGGVSSLDPVPSDNAGCSTAPVGSASTSSSTAGLAGLLVGLGLVLGARRRRKE
jgi:hypothetical protein